MVQLRSIIKVADNTGAKKLMVIQIYNGSKRRFGFVGEILGCIVKEASVNAVVQNHQKVKAVLVRAKKETKRKDGSYIRFDDNAAVIIKSRTNKEPVGTRIFGPAAREIKENGFNKIASMAKELL